MKKTILTITLILAWIGFFAQVCTGNFVFETQTEIDQFLSDNPTCETMVGMVNIRMGVDPDPIQNLNGLQNITTVVGSLIIDSWGLEPSGSLVGLSNLTAVDSLIIAVPANETSNWSGLENLQSVEYLNVDASEATDLHIFDNITTLENLYIDFAQLSAMENPPSLYNVFPSLTSVSDYLVVGFTPSSCDTITGFNSLLHAGYLSFGYFDPIYMTHFDGMHNLQVIESNFYNSGWSVNSISGFESVVSIGDVEMSIDCECDLPDFESLQEVGYMWLFNYCYSLPDFPLLTEVSEDLLIMGNANSIGFISLDSVVGSLNISIESGIGPYSLEEINMDSLRHVGGMLGIVGTAINNIDFLSNLETVGDDFYLEGNFNLTDCDIAYLCEQLPIAPEVFTINNGPGCASPEEVLLACGESYAAGLVFYDLDCDGVYNNDDFAVSNPILVNELNLPIGGSNAQGEYFIPLSDNTTSSISVSGSPLFSSSVQTITTGGITEAFDDVNFPLCPIENLHDISVSVFVNGQFRPGFNTYVNLYVHNNSIYTEDAHLVLNTQDMPGISNFAIYNGGTPSGNSIIWEVSDIPPFGFRRVSVQLHVDASIPLGQMLTFSVTGEILPNSIADVDPSNNMISHSQIVVGSYDPNDIVVNTPAYDYNLLEADQGISLEYTIRFQNTGTADAVNVRVTNLIEDNLDLSSFQLINISDPATLTFNENNEIEWLFENIMLPDSASNEEESHGFIQYRIKSYSNIVLEDTITNKAAIFFDFNEPIVTNTATTIFYECTQNAQITGVSDICEGDDVVLDASGLWNEYLWTIDGNVVGTTNELMMDNLSAGQQTISLHVSDTYCSDDADFVLDVTAIPETPVISQSGNTLTASGNGIFQWSMNGDILLDTDNSIDITESNAYSVSVTENGCSSEVSSGQFTYTGITENIESQLVIYPNPASSEVNLNLPTTGIWQLEILGSNGQLLQKNQLTGGVNSIDMKPEWCGLLMFKMMNESSGEEVKRTVVVAK